MKVLALCDSPAIHEKSHLTGFARVAKNILSEWSSAGVQVDIYGINFEGHGYTGLPWKIIPAGNDDWNSAARLTEFLRVIGAGRYTHVWILMNADALSVGDFPEKFQDCCRHYGVRSMLYFPIDCPQEESWLKIIPRVNVAVSYTKYGVEELRRAGCKSPVEVLPHGLESDFRPQPNRSELRKQFVIKEKRSERQFLKEDDFCILNVNKNEWRKDPLRTFEIVKGLREAGVPAKLVLRMAPTSHTGGIHLELAAKQVGLELDKDWVYLPPLADSELVALYNMADLYLTTTMGEGWGLGITEALGCGTPVAMPKHTACGEIGSHIEGAQGSENFGGQIVYLDPERGSVCGSDDMRLRPRVDLGKAIEDLVHYYRMCDWRRREPLPPSALDWLSWPRIAKRMLEFLKG